MFESKLNCEEGKNEEQVLENIAHSCIKNLPIFEYIVDLFKVSEGWGDQMSLVFELLLLDEVPSD